MGRFVFDPATGLMLPRRVEPRIGKRLCSLFTVGPGLFAASAPPPPATMIWDLSTPTNYTGNTGSFTISSSGRGLQENTNGAIQVTMKGNASKSSGKWYFEVVVTFPGNFCCVGVMDASKPGQNVVCNNGVTTNSDCWWRNNGQSFNDGATIFNGSFGSWSTGDVIGVAIDIGGATVKFLRNNSLAATLSRSMAATMTAFLSTDAGASSSGPYKWLLQTTSGQCSFSPPAGYSNWD